MEKVLIIGGGEIGQAVAQLLVAVTPEVFDKDPVRNNLDRPLSEAVANADAIFLCLPTKVLSTVVSDILPHLTEATPVVTLSKGLGASGDFVWEILEESLPQASHVVLGGPMLAEEIKAGRYAAAVVAAVDPDARQRVINVFSGTKLITESSDDPAGTAVCGVLKNIYTVGLAMADGLNLGDNTRGLLLNRALVEMAEIVVSFGGQVETAYSLAGLGDLVATSASVHSKNVAAGQSLARGDTALVESEGSLALPLLWPRLEAKRDHLPFMAAIADISLNHSNPKNVFTDLFVTL